MDTVTELDDASLFKLLLRLPYYQMTRYCVSNKQAQRICSNSALWREKIRQDYGIKLNPDQDAKVEYFKAFDSIDVKEGTIFDADAFIKRLVERIEFLEETSREPHRLYVAGFEEIDDEGFDHDSLYLKIGVIAKSKRVGWALVFLLWIIQDDREDLSIYPIEMIMGDDRSIETVSLTEVMDTLVSYWENFSKPHDLNNIKHKIWTWNKVTGKREDVIITNELWNIDLWTFPRIKKALEDIEFEEVQF